MKLFVFLLCLPALCQDFSEITRHDIFNNQRVSVADPTEGRPIRIPQHDDVFPGSVIAASAREAGLSLLSLSLREKQVNEDNGAKFHRIYLGYDGNLSQLVAFFQGVEEALDGVIIENLNISARRSPEAASSKSTKRPPILGNCIIMVPHSNKDLLLAAEERPHYSEEQVFSRLLLKLTQTLPEQSYLTSLVLKKETALTLFGETNSEQAMTAALDKAAYLSEQAPVKIIRESGQNNLRFMFKAKLDPRLL